MLYSKDIPLKSPTKNSSACFYWIIYQQTSHFVLLQLKSYLV